MPECGGVSVKPWQVQHQGLDQGQGLARTLKKRSDWGNLSRTLLFYSSATEHGSCQFVLLNLIRVLPRLPLPRPFAYLLRMHPLILLASALPLLAHAQTQQSQLPNSCIPITSKSACSPFSDQISSVYPSRISPQLAVASSFNLDSYIATLLDSDNFCEYYGCTALPKSANNSQASIVSQIRYATSYACASTLVNAASPCSGNQVKYWSTEKCAVYIESFRSVLKQCTEQGASFTERRTLAIQNSETACRAIALSENGENLNLVLAVASDLGTCGRCSYVPLFVLRVETYVVYF